MQPMKHFTEYVGNQIVDWFVICNLITACDSPTYKVKKDKVKKYVKHQFPVFISASAFVVCRFHVQWYRICGTRIKQLKIYKLNFMKFIYHEECGSELGSIDFYRNARLENRNTNTLPSGFVVVGWVVHGELAGSNDRKWWIGLSAGNEREIQAIMW